MKITKIEIKRFRSILDLEFELNPNNNFATICGANNSGKTNVLKSLNLFFNPNEYVVSDDVPNHKYYGSRGGATYPIISLFFSGENEKWKITREFGLEKLKTTKGFKTDLKNRNKTTLSETEITSFLNQFAFFFIPSINISFPKLINNLLDDVYDLEYEKSRFSGLKQELKTSFERYITGLVEILNKLASEINPIFEQFNSNWNVGFVNTADVLKFKDLISEDINFFLNDKSNRNIEGKGSGLQRLAYILLHSRIIEKLKKKNVILCIDEPDVFLHQGLQKKLKEHLLILAKTNQIIITTHSQTFIDSYKLDNVFLLDLEIGEEVNYVRTGTTFYPLSTKLVNIYEENGSKKIRDYLGVVAEDYDLLDNYNIIVEGECDKKYLTETSNFFGIAVPKIISADGVTNIEKYLKFYNSFYKDRSFKPCLLIIVDNDEAGREEYRKIYKKVNSNSYTNLEIRLETIPTYDGNSPNCKDIIENRVKSNYEIEDFIYPELLFNNVNKILKSGGYSLILFKHLEQKISAPAFKEKGILYNLDLLKSDKNPNDGHNINFCGKHIKSNLANLYNLQANKKIAEQMSELTIKYPEVKKYLERISSSANLTK